MNRVLYLSLFLSIFLNSQAYDCMINGICYNLDKDKLEATVTYKEYIRDGENHFYEGYITIPEKFRHDGCEYTVTAIGDDAFFLNTGLLYLDIPESVKEIGKVAFSSCENLLEINLPKNLRRIENNTFYGCKRLKRVSFPERLESIGDYAFCQCENLTDLSLPQSLYYIGQGAFIFCKSIRNIILPHGVKSLSTETFAGCNNIETIEVSESWLPLAPNYFSGNPKYTISSQRYVTSNENILTSDIDIDIPDTNRNSSNTLALIIANESYSREAAVEYAENDGKALSIYLNRVFGVPESNISLVHNATLNDIRIALSELENKCLALNGDASVILYYAGHGVPDEQNREAFLLPVDGFGTDSSTGFALSELYRRLENLPSMQTIALIDACFSGSQRNGNMLSSTRGVRIKPKKSNVKGNLVVISATKDDESAFPYEDKKHGLFTYFILKKIQEMKGNVSLGEIAEYVNKKVKQTSVIKNNRIQTPTVTVSPKMQNWESLPFVTPGRTK